jgi:NAD(P)H-dependent flavin oxidoreductase YrpB (nitropropane dioxygenase family)
VAFAHTKDVIAAVTNAGGIGVLGAVGIDPDELASDIQWIKERVGDKPFGVDLLIPASYVEANLEELEAMIPQGHRDWLDDLQREHNLPVVKDKPRNSGVGPGLLQRSRKALDIVLEERVPIFASGLGSPAFVIQQAHDAGVKVWGLVGRPRQAVREIEAGVDLIVAQGYDAGGHSGTIGTFTLVPEVVRLAEGTNTLVLAAGGASSGRHLAAAIAMGADGIWTGTVWLTTHESDTELPLKQKIIDAGAEDATQSRSLTGKPVRQLPSKWSEAWKQPGAPEPLQMPLQSLLADPILQGIRDNKLHEWMVQPAGQSVVGVRSMRPARDVVFEFADEAHDMFERIGARGDDSSA